MYASFVGAVSAGALAFAIFTAASAALITP